MIDIILGLLCMLLIWGVMLVGIVYAFCPINDKDTTTTWRVVTLLVTLLIVSALITWFPV